MSNETGKEAIPSVEYEAKEKESFLLENSIVTDSECAPSTENAEKDTKSSYVGTANYSERKIPRLLQLNIIKSIKWNLETTRFVNNSIKCLFM